MQSEFFWYMTGQVVFSPQVGCLINIGSLVESDWPRKEAPVQSTSTVQFNTVKEIRLHVTRGSDYQLLPFDSGRTMLHMTRGSDRQLLPFHSGKTMRRVKHPNSRFHKRYFSTKHHSSNWIILVDRFEHWPTDFGLATALPRSLNHY